MSILWNVMLVAVLSIANTNSITVRNGAYHNVVIEIEKDVPASDCFNVLLSLENALKLSSEYLYSSLDDHHIYYASFDIILPYTWPNDCVNRTNISNYNGAPSDITITQSNEVFGDEPWTQQSGGCEEAGDQIFFGYESFTEGNITEKFVTEWLKYRYGVFDVNGFENDPLYPPCGTPAGDRNPTCNDAMRVEKRAQQSVSFVHQLSRQFPYNRYLPSKQNHLCDRRRPFDIIMNHSDFNRTEQIVKFVEPTFRYVKKTLTRYMVIIDDHSDINIRDSFQFLREAMRKWLEKDLDQKHTEVGFWLMGNATKSEDVERNLIKSIYAGDDREEIFSTLPWYIEHRSGPKCMLTHAIMKSVDLMKERARTHGTANSVIVVIAPGMFKCPEEQTNDIISLVKDANIKVTTINYPAIGQNRIAMDQLAYGSGGHPFTIIERKQSSDKSLLTTFFELTRTLQHISALYRDGDVSPLPVEIYRKELIDSGSREENKPTSDSFNVDEATDFINFFVYVYDLKERKIEKGMKLISPTKHEFSTTSDLRAEYHQISIIGNMTGYGSWSYNIKRFYGNPQPHFVQVLAYPKADTQDFITTKAFIKKSRNGGPHVLYAQVMKGSLPIMDALVEVTIKHDGRKVAKKQLFDNGSGDPDVTRGDGIYSRYFAVTEPGMYSFEIFVTDNGNTAYAKARTSDDETPTASCCGSVVPISAKQTVAPFQRHLIPMTIFVSLEEIQQELTVLPFIGRIGDLKSTQLPDEPKIILEWTGIDVGRDNVKVSYEIRYATHMKDIQDDFETLSNKWTVVDTIPHNIGQMTSVTLNLADEPSLINQPFYIAIKSIVEGDAAGPVSNYVRVFVPKKKPTPSPHYTFDSANGDPFDMDPSIEPSYDESDNGLFQSNTKIAGLNLDVFIAIILCSLAAIIMISIYCWCCIIRTRNFQKAKKTPIKSETKPTPSISVIVPQSQPNQYNVDPIMNGSMYYADVPDHHTIGLPIDDDMMKPEYLDHDKMLFEEMKHHRQFQQQVMMDPYEQDVSIHNGTLTRNGRYLSPFESWTASQLLLEHERINQRSPLDVNDPSIMYVDANGEMVPPIPPHPYQNNYTSTPVDDSRYPPPQYSSVYRPGQNGSMQSVCNGEKKVRNVTMV